jgi:hypothetical protein
MSLPLAPNPAARHLQRAQSAPGGNDTTTRFVEGAIRIGR